MKPLNSYKYEARPGQTLVMTPLPQANSWQAVSLWRCPSSLARRARVMQGWKRDLQMPKPLEERRKAPRHPLILTAEVTEVQNGTRLNARASDISSFGCYLDTLNTSPVGTAIKLRLTHGGEVFQAGGRVVFESRGLGMGVVFVDLPAEQLAILERWLAPSISA